MGGPARYQAPTDTTCGLYFVGSITVIPIALAMDPRFGRLWNRVPYFRLRVLAWTIIGLVTVLLSQRQIHYNRKSYKCQLTNCRRYFLFYGVGPPVFKPPQIHVKSEKKCILCIDSYRIICYSMLSFKKTKDTETPQKVGE